MTDYARVDAYAAQLERALGNDEAFMVVFEELRNGSDLNTADLIAIASKFVAPMAASSTKQKALDRILKRHQNLMSFKRKQKAVGGRSAA
jgi:hypothetical protein